MGYDLRIYIKTKSGVDLPLDTFHAGNITYNVGDMLRALGVMDKEDNHKLESAKEWVEKLDYAIRQLTWYPHEYRKYEAWNGWGRVSTTLDALNSVQNEMVGQLDCPDWREAFERGDLYVGWY